MLKLRKHNRFNREYKNALKQKGNTEAQFLTVLNYLVNENPLPQNAKTMPSAIIGQISANAISARTGFSFTR